MRNSFQHARLWIILLLAALVSSCGYYRKNETYSQTAAVTPRFSSINARIIQPKCMPCHESASGEGDLPDFSSYAGVLREVRSGNPSRSEFYKQVESGDMPVGRPMLNDDEILAISQWIQNGAAND